MKPFIHYITHWYKDKEEVRFLELQKAIQNQLSSSLILSASILSIDKNVPFILIDHRPTFFEMVEYERTDLNVINILTNTDCYIELEDLPLLFNIEENEVWCLSRQDLLHYDSQDAWIWRGKLNISNSNYTMGLPGCDNRFTFDCAASGRKVNNPCLSIRLNHIHESKIRHWTEQNRIPTPYLFVTPVKLNEESILYYRGDQENFKRLKNEKIAFG